MLMIPDPSSLCKGVCLQAAKSLSYDSQASGCVEEARQVFLPLHSKPGKVCRPVHYKLEKRL